MVPRKENGVGEDGSVDRALAVQTGQPTFRSLIQRGTVSMAACGRAPVTLAAVVCGDRRIAGFAA